MGAYIQNRNFPQKEGPFHECMDRRPSQSRSLFDKRAGVILYAPVSVRGQRLSGGLSARRALWVHVREFDDQERGWEWVAAEAGVPARGGLWSG